jgi:TPR repeat protein
MRCRGSPAVAGRLAVLAGCAIILQLLCAAPARADLDAALERLRSGDFENALPELRVLARGGDARAQDTLAGLYVEGIGVDRDVDEAMGWYCRVAHQRSGGPEVMHAVWFLAEYFRTGGGVPGPRYNDGRSEAENPLRAYFWFSVMAGQQELYETVDARSVILGKIGVNTVGGVLLAEEKIALGEALERWRPTRPVDSPEACLALPDGLSPP